MDVRLPDGTVVKNVPDGTTHAQLMGRLKANGYGDDSFNAEAALDTVKDVGKNIGLGALSGAANIGATILQPLDWASDKLTGKTAPTMSGLVTGEKPLSSNEERRQKLKAFFTEQASPDSNAFKVGELGSEIAGTAGMGSLIAKVPVIASYAPKLAAAIESGGFRLGGAPATTAAGKVAELATRAAGGAITGGASAGLVNPQDAAAGAVIGGALPVGVKVAGELGRKLAPKAASPEVQALYQRAKDLGIDIPADRIASSRPMNAVASSLSYVPFSGRAATEEKMVSQFNRAVSRTIGQDTDNMTAALRRADLELGAKFEKTLSQNVVKYDEPFVNDLVANLEKARLELTEQESKLIGRLTDDFFEKAKRAGNDLVIDGQAAYNIKKTLDRIGNRQSNEAFYARELKKSLMGALDRSLGPTEAQAFKTLRQQYGNMLDLEGVAQRGAEGPVSIGKLANMKDLNPELGELADIAAQFLKTREGPHGAAQRVALGTLGIGAAGATGMLPAAVGAMATGRAANAAFNSQTLKNALLGRQGAGGGNQLLADPVTRALIYNQANRASP